MVWIFCVLLVAQSLTHLALARCNSKIVEKIKALNLNNENVLDNIDGEYKFVFFSTGRINGKSKGLCVKLRFSKEEEKHKVEYVGATNGKYDIEVVDGVIQQTGPQGKVDMLSHIIDNGPDVVAFYTCSAINRLDPTLTYVAVSTKVKNATERYQKARENLAKIGVKNGVEMPACLDSDGESLSEGNNGENAFTNAMDNVENEGVEDDDNAIDDDDVEEEEAAKNQEHQHQMALLKEKEDEEHNQEENEEE